MRAAKRVNSVKMMANMYQELCAMTATQPVGDA